MALRILQFGALFAIGFYPDPTLTTTLGRSAETPQTLGRNVETPAIPRSLNLTDPKDVIVPKGQSATFRCDARSSTGLQITWRRNDVAVPLDDTRWIQRRDGSLYIPKVVSGKKANGVTGEYECLATNKAGTLRSSAAKLRVASMDRDFTTSPSDLTVAKSQPALLRCSIHSTPPADIQWEFNNLPLPQNTRYVPLPSGALLISNSQISDAGSYRCKATNNILNKYKYTETAVLTVSPSSVEAKPTFLPLDTPPKNTVNVGQNLSLYCAVMGWPTPTIRWLNNDNEVVGNSTVLQILNVTVQHKGDYTCLAYNTKGRISQTFRVEVVQKPYFVVAPVSKSYPVPVTIRMDCQAMGVPEPRIYWLKNGEPLVYKNHIKRQATGLVFSHTFKSDGGMYQCVAVNSAGKVWTAAQIYMNVSHSPRPPENLQCRSYDATSICLSWNAPKNVSVQGYSVYSFYKGQLRDETGPEIVTNLTHNEASGLNTSTNYTFYVRLYAKTASDRSEMVTCETGVKGTRNLDIVPISANSVSLQWAEISSDVPCDGSETHYKVQWKKEGHSTTNIEYTSEHAYIISGLSPGTNYEFRISSTSYDKDLGDWTSYTHSRVEGNQNNQKIDETNNTNIADNLPPPPEQLEGIPTMPTSIKLVWADVANKKFYTICYVLVKEGKRCEEGKLLKSFSNKLLVDQLASKTTYEFKVRTHSLEGVSGPFSKSIEVQTPADVPSPILNLEFKPINKTTACLRWKVPEHKNGKLKNYLISYTSDRNQPPNKWTNMTIPSYQRKPTACWLGDQDTISTLLKNLSSNTYYTVAVWAESEVGLGRSATPIDVITNLPKKTEKRTPDLEGTRQHHKKVGIIAGVILALICILCCITCILVRRRCLKRRALARARMAASNNYYPAVAHYASNVGSVQVRLEDPCAANLQEIQHLVAEGHSTHIPPISPSHLDTKGGEEFPNGHVNGSAKPYMNGHLSNGHVHITENPQFFTFESNGHVGSKKSKHSPALRYEEDSNSNVKPSKFYDLHRLFENSKKANPTYHQCNPHFEQEVSRFRNSTSSVQSLDQGQEAPLNDKQLTCLDDTLGVSVVNNNKRISPVLGPNG